MAAKASLRVALQRLTAEERLNAFLAHSRLMVELRTAGTRLGEPANTEDRASPRNSLSKSTS